MYLIFSLSSYSTSLCLLFHNFYPIKQPSSKKNITDVDHIQLGLLSSSRRLSYIFFIIGYVWRDPDFPAPLALLSCKCCDDDEHLR